MKQIDKAYARTALDTMERKVLPWIGRSGRRYTNRMKKLQSVITWIKANWRYRYLGFLPAIYIFLWVWIPWNISQDEIGMTSFPDMFRVLCRIIIFILITIVGWHIATRP